MRLATHRKIIYPQLIISAVHRIGVHCLNLVIAGECKFEMSVFDFDESKDLKPLVNFPDVVSITQNWPSGDKDAEIKHLKQELEIKTLEKIEPEMKIKKILLQQDKGYLDVKMNELGLKAETLKSKKTDIDEQIREVKNLLRT